MINSEIRSSESTDDDDVEYAIGALMGALIRNALKDEMNSALVSPAQKRVVLDALSMKLYVALEKCVEDFSDEYDVKIERRAEWNDAFPGWA